MNPSGLTLSNPHRSLVCLTIAPAFFTAAVYLTLSRLVVIYAPDRSRLRPQVYTYIFITCDLVALILQAVGGAMASMGDPGSSMQQAGVDTMIAGMAWQVVSLALFGLLSLEFWLRARAAPLNPAFAELRARRLFQPAFVVAIAAAGVVIFVRCVFRCAELSAGFDGPLANDEVTLMVLEGAMIVLACIVLTVFHPSIAVGPEAWSAASAKEARKRGSPSISDVENSGQELASQTWTSLDGGGRGFRR